MSHVEFRPDLDAHIAERVMKPHIDRALDMLLDSARTKAPPTRTWVTMRDERVRRTHFIADGQTIPDNLRFILEKPDGTGNELGRHPGDMALSPGNRFNCRCDDPTVGHLLRLSIHRTPVMVNGTRVEGSVQTRFPRAAESEFGTSEDTPAHFMTGALQEVALRLQSGHAR